MRHGYFANISYFDAQVGRVLAALDASGVADRTIVVFLSDHGYQVGEHGLWGKTSNFEYDARVPLLIRNPVGSTQPGSTDSLAELIDLFPTLTELCGLPQPEGLEGSSLVPVLQNAEARVKAAAMTQHPRPAYYDRTPSGEPQLMGYSVRTASARYTEWRDWATGRTTSRELYLQSDEPAELRNVVDDPAAAGVLRECVELLSRQGRGQGGVR
jgi:iduronate 2-sulfatase